MLEKEDKLAGNHLIFSNKTEKDIILEGEFRTMLGENFINTLTDKRAKGFDNKHIDKKYLSDKISDFSKKFYVCGPEKMVKEISEQLEELGADTEGIVFEK